MKYQHSVLTVKTPDFEMDYIHFGEGRRPLVILPGMSLRPVTLTAGAVALAYGQFGEDYTVYLFERKKDITDGYTAEDMAEDTAAAMGLLGLSGADVIGFSQGGMLAQSLAIRHPEAVHKLVLGSTAARPNDTSVDCMNEWRELALAGDVRGLNRSFSRRVFSEDYREQYKDAFALLENEGTPEELSRFALLAEATRDFDVYEQLGGIRCPVLVMGSDRDQVLSGAASREIAEKLSCKLYMYEGYAHDVYDEAPDYRERMLTFFHGAEA